MENPKYQVRLFQDNTYEVLEDIGGEYDYEYETAFQGSLSDCEAFIRLKEKAHGFDWISKQGALKVERIIIKKLF